jgi:hypothetical protein
MKKSKQNKKNSFKSNFFLSLIFFFLILLLVFLFFELNINFDFKKEVQNFNIPDSCGLIGGELLHEIPSESDCKTKCFNLCGVRNLNYYNYSFQEGNLTCHTCECSCK